MYGEFTGFKFQDSWREVVAIAAQIGIPTPAFSAALAFYDGYRSSILPANLIQAQRDYFGVCFCFTLIKNYCGHNIPLLGAHIRAHTESRNLCAHQLDRLYL